MLNSQTSPSVLSHGFRRLSTQITSALFSPSACWAFSWGWAEVEVTLYEALSASWAASEASSASLAVSGPAAAGPPGGRFQWGSLPEQKSCSSRRPALCSSGRACCTTQPRARASARNSSAAVGALHRCHSGNLSLHEEVQNKEKREKNEMMKGEKAGGCAHEPWWWQMTSMGGAAAHAAGMSAQTQMTHACSAGAPPVRVILGLWQRYVVGCLQLLPRHLRCDDRSRGAHIGQPVNGDDTCMVTAAQLQE